MDEIEQSIDQLAENVEGLEVAVEELAETIKALGGSPGPAGQGAVDASTELLVQIRDGISALVKDATEGKRELDDGKDEPSYRWKDALKPITEPLQRTRLGRIGSRFMSRARPALRAMRGSKGTKAGRGLGGLLGRLAPTGGAATGAGGGAATGAAAGAGGGALAALGPVAAVIGAVVAVGAAMKEAGEAIVDFAYEMETANRKLAEFSPSQALVWNDLDIRRMDRGMTTGENTSSTAQDLADSIDKFEAATRPFEELGANLKNMVGGKLLDLVSNLVRLVTPIAEWANRKIGSTPESDDGFQGNWLQQMYEHERQRTAAARSDMDRLRDHHYRGR